MEISIPNKTVFILGHGPHIILNYFYVIMPVGCRIAYDNNEMIIYTTLADFGTKHQTSFCSKLTFCYPYGFMEPRTRSS